VSVRAWVRDRTAEGRVARRIEALVGEPRAEPSRVARVEPPGRLGAIGARATSRFGVRLDPGRRGATAVGAAAVVAVLVAGCWVLVNRPHSASLGPAPSAARTEAPSQSPASSAASASATKSASVVVVDVVGKVANPGVYRLPVGARVGDAVQAAGGALPGVDLATVNLAQILSDGQQIAVAVAGAPAAAADSAGSNAGPVNLNTATAAQLDALPGVGPVLAQHIIDWRTAHGSFTSLDQLREVSGIGEAKFADLRPLVTV
jgi:competence protein ComEA